MLLSSTVREDNVFLFIDMTNVDTTTHGDIVLPRGTLHVFRRKFLDNSICYEQVRLENYGLETISVSIGLHFDADFADIFEVRGRFARSAAKGYPTELSRMKLQSHTEVWTGWSAGRCCGSRPLLTS
jgi:glycogen debranching enzyme